MFNFLSWVTPVDGFVARWNLDSSSLYRYALEQLAEFIEGIDEYEDIDLDKPTKWWLEVAHHFIKLLVERALKADGQWSSEVSNVLIMSNAPKYAQKDAPGAPADAKQAAKCAKKLFTEMYG